MVCLEEIVPGTRVKGILAGEFVEILAARSYGSDAVEVTYKANGGVDQTIVFRSSESDLELASPGRRFAFDGDGHLLRLASEALRIRLAHLFDPFLAVRSSQIEALPHQLTAVYGEMLPRQPLRFLLADDPGAGKTIMAGLLIKELLIRGDLERCLVVAPGGLVEQWQDELSEKFGLMFDILTRDQVEAAPTGNFFAERQVSLRGWICSRARKNSRTSSKPRQRGTSSSAMKRTACPQASSVTRSSTLNAINWGNG
jgi:SNF2-related domain